MPSVSTDVRDQIQEFNFLKRWMFNESKIVPSMISQKLVFLPSVATSAGEEVNAALSTIYCILHILLRYFQVLTFEFVFVFFHHLLHLTHLYLQLHQANILVLNIILHWLSNENCKLIYFCISFAYYLDIFPFA